MAAPKKGALESLSEKDNAVSALLASGGIGAGGRTKKRNDSTSRPISRAAFNTQMPRNAPSPNVTP